jgi:hypothetical protein
VGIGGHLGFQQQRRQIGEQLQDAVGLVVEQPEEKLVAGGHGWQVSRSILAAGPQIRTATPPAAGS